MIVAYSPVDGSLRPRILAADDAIPPEAIWIDLLTPGAEEERVIERALGVDVPTREEMREIEQSSRLYVENGVRYMTASVLCGTDTERPRVVQVSFVLAGSRLVTVRYDEFKAFSSVVGRLSRACQIGANGESVLLELLDAIIDRAADLLEQIAADIERLSHRIFDRSSSRENANQRYRAILSRVGRKEGIISSIRESLASLGRLVSFLGTEMGGAAPGKEMKAGFKNVSRDISGLSDYANFLGDKLQFLLDATIGMVGLEQNNIIKIFAVLSVVLMPPTLIASIYGMNFQHMPELASSYGYPIALCGMVVSGILPYVFFKWRGWL